MELPGDGLYEGPTVNRMLRSEHTSSVVYGCCCMLLACMHKYKVLVLYFSGRVSVRVCVCVCVRVLVNALYRQSFCCVRI